MFKQVIYIEKNIADHSATKEIVNKIQPAEIIQIENYKEVLNQNNSNWLFNKQFQKIILAERKDEFYYKGASLTSHLGYRYFYYNTLALNCLYHCEYCYLQGMYNTPHLVMFVNNQDFIKATRQLIQKLRDKIYLALSYDTDLPALEKFYPYCQEWMDFAAKEKNIIIEIRTKSDCSHIISNNTASDNIIFAFTLSPEQIIRKYESQTPALEHRIKSVNTSISKGFKTMLCFDPLIYIPDFKNTYSEFMEFIFEKITHSPLLSASVGTFRMNNDFLKRIRKNGNQSDIYYYQYEIKNKTASYYQNIRNEMIMFVKSELEKRGIKDVFIYE